MVADIRLLFADGERTDRMVGPAELAEIVDRHPFGLASVDDGALIEAFGEALKRIARRDHELYTPMRGLGLAYFLGFIHPESLGRMLERHLPRDPRWVRRPLGTAAHWLAGNVPILSMLSAVLAALTKNRSILKLPSQGLDTVSPLFETFAALGSPAATALSRSAVVVRFPSDCRDAQQVLADRSDVRMVWGAREAVDAVRRLESKAKSDAEVIAFGPRLSAAVVDPTCMDEQAWRDLAVDASLFHQLACTSPHFVLVKGGESDAHRAAEALRDALASIADEPFFAPPTAFEASRTLEYRARMKLDGLDVLACAGTDFTVAVGTPATAYGYRVLTCIPWSNPTSIAAHLPANVQTIGCQLNAADLTALTEAVRDTPVCRITNLGRMHDFEIPWDGINVLQRLVRTVSVSAVPAR